jgi:hypothetical protein
MAVGGGSPSCTLLHRAQSHSSSLGGADPGPGRRHTLRLVYAEFFRAGLLSFSFLANRLTVAAGHSTRTGAVSASMLLWEVPMWDADDLRLELLARVTYVGSSTTWDTESELEPSTRLACALARRWAVREPPQRRVVGGTTQAINHAIKAPAAEMRQLDLNARARVIHWLRHAFGKISAMDGVAFAEVSALVCSCVCVHVLAGVYTIDCAGGGGHLLTWILFYYFSALFICTV